MFTLKRGAFCHGQIGDVKDAGRFFISRHVFTPIRPKNAVDVKNCQSAFTSPDINGIQRCHHGIRTNCTRYGFRSGGIMAPPNWVRSPVHKERPFCVRPPSKTRVRTQIRLVLCTVARSFLRPDDFSLKTRPFDGFFPDSDDF